jgi:two-component sensor histidine kinase
MFSLINTLFTPPELKSTDFTFVSKYILAYRVALFCAISIAFLEYFLFTYFQPITGVIAGIALVAILFSIYLIRATQQITIPGLIINIIGALACEASLWFVNDQPHLADIQWIVINILFTFLVLPPKLGLGLTLIHGSSVALFIVFNLQNQIDNLSMLTDEQIWSNALNMLICFIIIGYLGFQNIRTNELAKLQLNQAQDVLQEQYNIISKQNEEKTVMLKEIHHRVKNNLQIITSLLRLQSRELESPEAIAKFKDATHRVIAMSMIHEKMYQSDHLSTMHLKEYLHDLSSDLVTSYQSGYPVQLAIECDVESIGLKSIVPLALIMNELISNSLKYAFDEYDNCEISISFTRFQDKLCRLVYSDSGTWKAPSRTGSFGLDLIESLTDQLEGSLKMETFPRTQFEFVFSPLEDE